MKRSGNRRRGNDAERRAQVWLEAHGYLVHRAVQSGFRTADGRWLSRTNDLFGCFDLLSLNAIEVRLISVTAGSASSRRKRIEAFGGRSAPPPCVTFELWRWIPGRPTRRSKVRQSWRCERWVPGDLWNPCLPRVEAP